jgi:putative copper resistance protein D
VTFGVWDAALIAIQTLTYGGTLGAAGAVFFLVYCKSLITSAERGRIGALLLAAAVLGVLAAALQIMLMAGSMSGDASAVFDSSLLSMVWQAGAGHAFLIRAIGLVFAALLVVSVRLAVPALLGATLAATSFAWTGHARALAPDVIPLLLQGMHLLAAAFWLGALMPLYIVARSEDTPRLAAAAVRFSSRAMFVVGALLAAGAALLCLLLGDPAALWGSAYGRLMMLKLALVAGLLSLAAFNKLRLTPRLRAGDRRASGQLRASIQAELALAALILAATATLTTLTGPPALA